MDHAEYTLRENLIKAVEGLFKYKYRQFRKVNSYGNQPLPNLYWPELGQSDDLIPELASRYLQLIGILCWALDIGRIYIFAEVEVMLQYSASPLLGNLEGLYNMFEYLKKNEMYRVIFDLFQKNVDESVFSSGTTDCKELYGYIKKELPPGILEPLGKNAHTTFFVDSNHYGNVVTRRLHTGVLVYVMNLPIIWLSKKHNND